MSSTALFVDLGKGRDVQRLTRHPVPPCHHRPTLCVGQPTAGCECREYNCMSGGITWRGTSSSLLKLFLTFFFSFLKKRNTRWRFSSGCEDKRRRPNHMRRSYNFFPPPTEMRQFLVLYCHKLFPSHKSFKNWQQFSRLLSFNDQERLWARKCVKSYGAHKNLFLEPTNYSIGLGIRVWLVVKVAYFLRTTPSCGRSTQGNLLSQTLLGVRWACRCSKYCLFFCKRPPHVEA